MGDQIPADGVRPYGAPIDAITGFLERLQQQHGGARGYLHTLGHGEELIALLEEELLEDG